MDQHASDQWKEKNTDKMQRCQVQVDPIELDRQQYKNNCGHVVFRH